MGIFRSPLNHIHSGLDFGGVDDASPEGCFPTISQGDACIRLTPICDGRVVKQETDEETDHTGARITFQCFTPEGSRSNIYVRYSHLENIGNRAEGWYVLAGESGGAEGLGWNAYQYEGNDFPHLHMEVMFDLDGYLADAIRINPLLLFDANRAQVIMARMGAYYPDVSNVSKEDRRFEWGPPDTIDPESLQAQPFDGVQFNINNVGLLESEVPGTEDMDIGIQLGELHPFSILADQQVLASGAEAICTYVWGRTDQLILFRYGPNQSCVTSGVQIIPTNTPDPVGGYNGPEWLLDRWVTGMPDLINMLLSHDT